MAEELDAVSSAVVLRRAFELARSETTAIEPTGLGRQTLAEIAAEVDLPLSALAAALAERQLGLASSSPSLLDRLVGPARLVTHRPSTAVEEEAMALAASWLETGHGLRPRVSAGGVLAATKRSDVVGKVARTVRDAQGEGRLGRLRRVEFAAVDVGDEPGAMVVAADLRDQRRSAVLGGAAAAVGTATVITVGAIVASPLILIGLPAAAGVGAVTSRVVHQHQIGEASADLDEFLDDLAQQKTPPTLLKGVADRLSRTVFRRRS